MQQKKWLVVGLGKSGRAAAHYLLSKGCHVVGADDHLAAIESDPSILQLCEKGLVLAKSCDRVFQEGIEAVVCSPGVPSDHVLLAQAKSLGLEVIGEVELACRQIQACCIGITGTNGKTTTTLLLEHILKQSGIRAKAVGNVGIPLIAELEAADHEVFVIELSSYQLETLSSKVLSQALILNITPDHLDRYSGMEGYIRAKFEILGALKEGGSCFIHESVKALIPQDISPSLVKTYGTDPSCDLSCRNGAFYFQNQAPIPVPQVFSQWMAHDVENIMAAYATCRALGVSDSAFFQGILTFKKLPHRIEFVRRHAEVDYYNDSKGTNVDAVIRAVEAMPGPVVLIAGGVSKNCSFLTWIEKFSGKVKRIYAIGEAAPLLKNELDSSIPVMIVDDLFAAVMAASTVARKGDVVLLSPGCASTDMFKNYEHRGDEFKRLVNAL